MPDNAESTTSTSTSGSGLPPLSALFSKRKTAASGGIRGSSKSQLTMEETFDRSSSFQEGGSRAAEIDDSLLFMICKDNLSLSTPENPGFNFYAKKTVPLWQPPSRRKITRLMENKYEVLSTLVKDALLQLPSLCLTADCWTEHNTTSSYLGVTVHFLVENEMQSAVLGVTLMTESHTSEYLAGQITDFCKKWGIAVEKVSLIVTDNAENIKLAAKLAFGANKHVPCFDHTLNLVPKAALGFKTVGKESVPNVPGVPPLVKKIKDIVTFSHTSYNFSNDIKRIQVERGRTEGTCLRLLQDVPTRWGSTFLMTDRFLDMAEVVSLASLQYPSVEMLSGAELATVRAMKAILQPFHRATSEMGAESTTTASKVIPMVFLLKKKVEDIVVSPEDAIAKAFKAFVLSELERRFTPLENVLPLATATMLDPRFLKVYFSSPIATSKTMLHIEGEIKKEMRLKAVDAASSSSVARPQSTDDTDPADLWSCHDTMVITAHSASTSDDMTGRARTELRAFLDRAPSPRSANPFKVWNSTKCEYPHLYKVAMRALPLVSTSVPSERLFSLAGRIMDDQRSRLSSEHLSQRIFLSSVSKELWSCLTVKP